MNVEVVGGARREESNRRTNFTRTSLQNTGAV